MCVFFVCLCVSIHKYLLIFTANAVTYVSTRVKNKTVDSRLVKGANPAWHQNFTL